MKFPVKAILLVAGAAVVLGVGYVCVGSVVESVVWSIAHGSVATYKGWPGTKYQGFSVKVPWMWRQEESLGSEQSVKLVRARLGGVFLFENAEIERDISVGDGLKRIQRTQEMLNHIKLQPGSPSLTIEDFRPDGDLADHFRCATRYFASMGTFSVECASNDGGRWFVNYENFEGTSVPSLNELLRSLAAQR